MVHISDLSPCNEHVGAILPKPTTQSPEEESYNFVPITIGLSVLLIGILALLVCLHKQYRHSFKAGKVFFLCKKKTHFVNS